MPLDFALRRAARRSTGMFLALTFLTAPAVVLASHQFGDVPNGHPFHSQIDAIAEAGITAGFPDGGYHPDEAVTRQAMAAFMHRGFGRVGLSTGSLLNAIVSVEAGSTSSGAVAVQQLTITVPGATNGFSPVQVVYLTGRVSFFDSMSTAEGCPCEFAARFRDTATNATTGGFLETFESDSASAFTRGIDVFGAFLAAPGAHTYELQVYLSYRAVDTSATSFSLDPTSRLSAMTFPFGPTGANTL